MHFLLRDVTCDQILNMNLRVDVLNYIFILPSIPGEYSIFSQLVLCAALDLKILFSSIYSIQNFHTVLGLTKLNSNRAHFYSEPRQWRDFWFRHTRISSHWFFSDIHRRKVCISFKSSWNLDPFLKHSLQPPSNRTVRPTLSVNGSCPNICTIFTSWSSWPNGLQWQRKSFIVSIWIAPLKLDNEVLSLLLAVWPSSGDDDNDGHVSASQPRIRIERHGKMWPAVCKH